jgi:hypothetical protein
MIASRRDVHQKGNTMNRRIAGTWALCGALLVCAAGAAQAQDAALPAKQAGVVRIGIVKPKVLVGTNDASQSGDSMRNILAEYLQGPTIEVALLSARLPSQYGVEARQAECDYILTTSLTHRRGSQGGGLGSTLGRLVGTSSYIPGMDYAKSAVVTGVLSTAADFAASVKAKDEMVLQYQLNAIDSTKPLLDKDAKRRAKADGEDLLTPLVESAADAVGTAIAK